MAVFLFISEQLAATVGTMSTRVPCVITTTLTPMVPTDGLWITELPCTIQHIHTGYKSNKAHGSSNIPFPRSVKPNPYKWVNPKLRQEPDHANAQRQPNLSFHDMSNSSCNWSERSVFSTSSQASITIVSTVPTPACKFEPASLYEEEPDFLELWGTL